ncbi:hypothetical protein H8B06_11880 [Sphingobacterium sp. DN00404]|uniref:Uncharacterized protein n=1 Tax=Sphingobacterium micropteri TaxID=2763501 RepID=A0ABR7YQN8_9SPHI|nr:hypothetical protein [Sphingobacterium micropteri]MBD1433531.1 hypothetical protein [Sphingobacterium micropteri]
MLDKPYKFRKASVSCDMTRPFIKQIIKYVFQLDDITEKKYIYIVEAELYDYNIYAIKYYPKVLKQHKYKYNILTEQHKANRIIATCMHIIFDIVNRDPFANIGFLASRTSDALGDYKEELRLTKRFRIYAQAFIDFFGPKTYSHFPDKNTSTYLLINNKNNVQEIKKCSEDMFTKIYPGLFSR